jgi:hypothetical protein
MMDALSPSMVFVLYLEGEFSKFPLRIHLNFEEIMPLTMRTHLNRNGSILISDLPSIWVLKQVVKDEQGHAPLFCSFKPETLYRSISM